VISKLVKSKDALLICITTLGIAALLAVGAWRFEVMKATAPAPHFVIIADPSESASDSRASVIGLASQALTTLEHRRGATITVFALGDASTLYEPRWIASYRLPENRHVLKGPDAIIEGREAILSDLANKYQVSPTTVSPIFRGIRRGIEHLRSLGCGPESECELWIQTDGEETVDPQIKAAIEAPVKGSLVPVIANDGIRVHFCGLAQKVLWPTAPDKREALLEQQRDSQRPERLQEVWRGLFSNADLLRFSPYCAGNSNP
jgi:hypothetical protein